MTAIAARTGHRPAILPFVAGVAFASTAYIASFTAASLAAREIGGTAELSGMPAALGTIGTAAAVALLSTLMVRRGRRAGLLGGYAVAIVGGVVTVLGLALGSLPLLLLGSLGAGFGNGSLNLSRYAASDHVPPERRAAAVSTVVWGSTAGAVLGPSLLQPAGSLAEALGRPQLEGGLAVTVVGFALALLVTWLWAHDSAPDGDGRLEGAGGSPAPTRTGRRPPEPGGLAALSSARVRVALVGLVSAQVVMVLIMTMTPVHVRGMGHPLTTVGLVISAHTLGMFALAPLSGRLVQRFGATLVLSAGLGTLLLSAVLAATAPASGIPVLTLGLFLLGYGWNLAFVAGSSLLAAGSDVRERIRLQGVADVTVWSSSALASISSGVLLEAAGYPALAVVGGTLLALPAIAILLARGRLVTA